MREWTRLPFAIGLVIFLGVAVHGQARKWSEPYQKGLEALKAKNYQAAVTLLEQAAAAEPRAAEGKLVEGVFRVDYNPYYYLGVAYLEMRNYSKAEENFSKAKSGLKRDLQPQLVEYQKRLTSESTLARAASPAPAPAPPPKPAGPNPNFEPAMQAASASLAAKRYAEAVASFDAAKAADPAEFTRTNAQSRRDEAARGAAGQQLALDARQLLDKAQVNAAKAKFQQADQTLPGQKAVADGLVEIRQRESTYQRLKAAAEQNVRDNDFRPALDNWARAKAANPEQFAADNLEARIRTINDRLKEAAAATASAPAVPAAAATGGGGGGDASRRADSLRLFTRATFLASQGNYADAEKGFSGAVEADPQNREAAEALKKSRQFSAWSAEAAELARQGNMQAAKDRFAEARNLDAVRFDRDGLAGLLERLTKQAGQDPGKIALRAALVALLNGDAHKSAAILEPAVARRAGDTPTAALHAYLGVAYAMQALSSIAQDETARALREKALAQFRLAVSAERDYRLSTRVVSPKIVALFEQARAS